MSPTFLIKQRDFDASINGLHSNDLVNRLYAARGITSETEANLSLQYLHNPDSLLNINAAVQLLLHAIEQHQRIVVVGDFDCDGATGTAVAVRGLRMLGATSVLYKVPHRVHHGYGLTPELVEDLQSLTPQLILTVDCGIACIPGVAAAKAKGYTVIITDHHLPGDTLPCADAIVNPNQHADKFPSKAMAGVGVMFYVLLAVRKAMREKNLPNAMADLSSLLDLVAIGTVADMVKLDGNNRRLIRAGISRIRKGQCHAGVRALAKISGVELSRFSETDIGFRVAPRLNAAGRLEDMSLGIECLLSDEDSIALEHANSLHAINVERQDIQQVMLDDAESIVQSIAVEKPDAFAHVLFEHNWHPGVLGLVASRIKESMHRPVIAFAQSDEYSAQLRGSARSIPGFHIRDAIAQVDANYPGLISRFGGHAMAAGLSLALENFEAFKQHFLEVCQQTIAHDILQGVLWTDGELNEKQFTRESVEQLQQAGPWGQGFAAPLFENTFEVLSWQVLKDVHLKMQLRLTEQSKPLSAIFFNGYQGVAPERILRVVYELQNNDYRDKRDIQALVRHIEPA